MKPDLRRMLQFVQAFPDRKIVAALQRQLGWSHFKSLIPMKNVLKRESTPRCVERAGVLFGITMSRALNVNNLRGFSDKLTAKVQEAVCTRAHEVADTLLGRADGLGVKGPRQATAQAVRGLLYALCT